MPNLKDIKRRITSVQNTQQITRAMKMVAAAKFRKAYDRIIEARPYSGGIQDLVSNLAASVDTSEIPLLRTHENEKKVLLVLITSDRGLCGSFNTNLIKEAETFLGKMSKTRESAHLYTIGRKGNEYFKKFNRATIVGHEPDLLHAPAYKDAAAIAQRLMDMFLEGEYDRIMLCYNEFKSALTQILTVKSLLPVELNDGDTEENSKENKDEKDEAERTFTMMYEPDKQEVLEQLLPKHFRIQLYRAVLESLASEHGARMTAMENATINAGDMIRSLTLQYNRTRQAAITGELMEIVGGAEALKSQ